MSNSAVSYSQIYIKLQTGTLLSVQLNLFAIPPSMLLYQHSTDLPLFEQSLHCTSRAHLIEIVCSTLL